MDIISFFPWNPKAVLCADWRVKVASRAARVCMKDNVQGYVQATLKHKKPYLRIHLSLAGGSCIQSRASCSCNICCLLAGFGIPGTHVKEHL